MKRIILTVLTVITFTTTSLKASTSSNTKSINCLEISNPSVQSYKFVLTHLLGKKLTSSAFFTVGNISVWTLDFRNGDEIRYTIKSKSGSNPLCGLSAKDNMGDYATICVTPGSGGTVTVEIAYNSRNFKYTGYISR
jgi:hypothetical protein